MSLRCVASEIPCKAISIPQRYMREGSEGSTESSEVGGRLESLKGVLIIASHREVFLSAVRWLTGPMTDIV